VHITRSIKTGAKVRIGGIGNCATISHSLPMENRGAEPLPGGRVRRRGAGATGALSNTLELNIF
jgi:hypothetical protein